MVFILQLFFNNVAISHALFATEPQPLGHSWHGRQGAPDLFSPGWH